MNKKPKTQEKYKQLLIAYYDFKEVDFYFEGDKILCCSKDNAELTPRDIYEELVREKLTDYILRDDSDLPGISPKTFKIILDEK